MKSLKKGSIMPRSKITPKIVENAVEKAIEPTFTLDPTVDTPQPVPAPEGLVKGQKEALTASAEDAVALAGYRGYGRKDYISAAIEYFHMTYSTTEQDKKLEKYKEKYNIK